MCDDFEAERPQKETLTGRIYEYNCIALPFQCLHIDVDVTSTLYRSLV